MSRGKSINLYLIDGDPNRRIKCSLANWTGVIYKIPRNELNLCHNIEVLKQSGVQILFGVDENNEEQVAYIGQSGVRKNGDCILRRLYEHKQDESKDYWN